MVKGEKRYQEHWGLQMKENGQERATLQQFVGLLTGRSLHSALSVKNDLTHLKLEFQA